ncbi:hypothetical protein PCAR4_460035 [Paraburkholderia caribensis]|nr:hypothetical protein PCAR4_460035 [Paraburkholderia caribensis]
MLLSVMEIDPGVSAVRYDLRKHCGAFCLLSTVLVGDDLFWGIGNAVASARRTTPGVCTIHALRAFAAPDHLAYSCKRLRQPSTKRMRTAKSQRCRLKCRTSQSPG